LTILFVNFRLSLIVPEKPADPRWIESALDLPNFNISQKSGKHIAGVEGRRGRKWNERTSCRETKVSDRFCRGLRRYIIKSSRARRRKTWPDVQNQEIRAQREEVNEGTLVRWR
jgi:hypothetical protein